MPSTSCVKRWATNSSPAAHLRSVEALSSPGPNPPICRIWRGGSSKPSRPRCELLPLSEGHTSLKLSARVVAITQGALVFTQRGVTGLWMKGVAFKSEVWPCHRGMVFQGALPGRGKRLKIGCWQLVLVPERTWVEGPSRPQELLQKREWVFCWAVDSSGKVEQGDTNQNYVNRSSHFVHLWRMSSLLNFFKITL